MEDIEDIQTFVTYRGTIFYQKGCPMVHRISGKLYAKNQGPYSKDEKVISLSSPFQDRDMQTLWLIKVMYAIKRNILWFIGS